MSAVTASAGQPRCNQRHEGLGGVRCTRPEGHQGGHLDHITETYWQASVAEPVAVQA